MKMTKELYSILSSYKNARAKIRELTLEIEELETHLLPSGIRYDKDSVQVSPSDPMFEIISKVADLQRERDQMLKTVTEAMTTVCDLIDTLDDASVRLILKYRWIECLEWKDIAIKVSYSEQWCYEKSRNALKILETRI